MEYSGGRLARIAVPDVDADAFGSTGEVDEADFADTFVGFLVDPDGPVEEHAGQGAELAARELGGACREDFVIGQGIGQHERGDALPVFILIGIIKAEVMPDDVLVDLVGNLFQGVLGLPPAHEGDLLVVRQRIEVAPVIPGAFLLLLGSRRKSLLDKDAPIFIDDDDIGVHHPITEDPACIFPIRIEQAGAVVFIQSLFKVELAVDFVVRETDLAAGG